VIVLLPVTENGFSDIDMTGKF